MTLDISEFCGGSKFWDTNLLVNSSYPQFTKCFMNTALVWVPCGLLWAGMPLYLCYLTKEVNVGKIKPRFLNVAKLLCCLIMAGMSITRLIHHTTQDRSYPALYLADAIRIATYLMTIVPQYYERRKRQITSPPLFLFWLATTIANIIPFYTHIEQKLYQRDLMEFVLFYFFFAFCCLQVLLFSFAEKSELDKSLEVSQNPSLEVSASFPSRLTYWWMNTLIWTGYKKDLTESDVQDLNPIDEARACVPPLAKSWEKEKLKISIYNKEKLRKRERLHSSHDSKNFLGSGETEKLLQGDRSTNYLSCVQENTDYIFHKDKAKQLGLKVPSYFKAMIMIYGPELLFLQILRTGMDLLKYVTPQVTEALLTFVKNKENESVTYWRGYVLAMSYFVISFVTSILSSQLSMRNNRLGMYVRCSTLVAIYKKALTISNNARKESTLGEIVNLMSVDTPRLARSFVFLYIFISAPCQLAVALYMLFDQIGISVMAGVGVALVMFPLNAIIISRLRKLNREQMSIKDNRMRFMNEVLHGIKVLKLFAWENPFMKRINTWRNKELKTLFKLSFFRATISLIFQCVPYFVQTASFGVFIALDGYLDPAKAFVSMQLLNMLTNSIRQLPQAVPQVVQAYVAIERISEFLRKPDIDPNVVIRDPKSDFAIEAKNASFTWDEDAPSPTLRNINLQIKPGSLVAIVGRVGSGKSSLLSAMLGEMNKTKGNVTVKSSVAYVPQEAWIQNKTLRDNILFDSELKESSYEKVIDACALQADLDILPGGDLTEIGEKGINISGGQKQRISLARAIYSKADIYLLDDPLSAVDSHVGKHIFQKVLSKKGMISDKTRVLVTHGIQWLPQVDTIVVVKDGSVSEIGSYEELVSHQGEFAMFLKEYFTNNEYSDEEDEANTDPEVVEAKKNVLKRLESLTGTLSDDEMRRALDSLSHSGSYKKKKQRKTKQNITKSGQETGIGNLQPRKQKTDAVEENGEIRAGKIGRGSGRAHKLIEKEKAETGRVKFRIFAAYLKAVGWQAFVLSTLFYGLNTGAQIFSGVWMSKWTDSPLLANRSLQGTDIYDDENNMYLGVYAGVNIAKAFCFFLFVATLLSRTVAASGTLHEAMLNRVMRAPMSFFDTTPTGRILNRFSKDVETLDNNLPGNLRQVFNGLGSVLVSLITIAYSSPLILCVIAPITFIYYLLQKVYIPASRQIRRIDSTTRSPIYAHFSESLSGVYCIRAFSAQDRFVHRFTELMDYNLKFYYASLASNIWLSIRIGFLGNIVVLAAAMFAVSSDNLTGGLAGLSISYASTITGGLSNLIQMTTQMETNIVAVERIVEYTDIAIEKAWSISDSKPNPGWPEDGQIEIENLELRYRPGLELVLKGINAKINPGEKVGIVGRTGAGKSSLTTALFRLVESASGALTIDDLNISTIGLHDLRNQITILPQDPVIFAGTIRSNVDPADLFVDEEVWKALEHAHLKQYVSGLPSQLNHECGEGGTNLSMGQRQLICLARTLLRKTKILVLDEATAAVDMETDELIQKTIRTEFKDSTVLTIAHRLNTILDYNKVIVMDQGLIKEMDSPSALLANPDSIFYNMAKDAKLV